MAVWFVSRHPGAVEWAHKHALPVDRWVAHLDASAVQSGDTVAGTLPVHMAAQVCSRGAHYLHLSLELPPDLRGRELNCAELERANARLDACVVEVLPVRQMPSKKSNP